MFYLNFLQEFIMKKTTLVIFASAVIASGCASVGANENTPKQGMSHGKMPMMAMHMEKMDTNADGLASKEEFMKFHEQMFDMMKNKDGVIDLKEMHKHCKGMMGGMEGGMMGGGHMMQPHKMEKPNQ
jgi:PBP1b-binding outer membrane lipoprotein LpoB